MGKNKTKKIFKINENSNFKYINNKINPFYPNVGKIKNNVSKRNNNYMRYFIYNDKFNKFNKTNNYN